MEQKMMDADGGRVIHQRRRTGKLAVVVAVQNVVVAACLVATLFLYLDFQKDQTSTDTTVHIQFDPITVSHGNGNITLQFQQIASNYSMDVNKNKSKIYIKCKGPYIWYMDMCYKSLEKGEATEGRLELKMADATVSYVTLNTTSEVCRGHHSIVNLRANTESSLELISKNGFKLMNVTVGLSYLLGKRCEF